jgi:hypothetical protein
VDQAEAHFDPFGDSFNFGARKVQQAWKSLWDTRLYSCVMYVKWMLVLVCLEIVLASAQDRCMVCAECTTVMEVISGTPDGTPR